MFLTSKIFTHIIRIHPNKLDSSEEERELLSGRARELSIDLQRMMITVPMCREPSMILLDPGQGKAKLYSLIEHGETIIKSSQGRIAKVEFRESELF